MEKERLVAFSDGVIAVIITIMVLELKAPHNAGLNALKDTIPVFSRLCPELRLRGDILSPIPTAV
jgi:uncharacterized membrane protein